MLPAVAVNDEGEESWGSGGPARVVAWFGGAESKGLADPAQLFQRYITAMPRNVGRDRFRDIRGKGTYRTSRSSSLQQVRFHQQLFAHPSRHADRDHGLIKYLQHAVGA